jgi:hypothetical protein
MVNDMADLSGRGDGQYGAHPDEAKRRCMDRSDMEVGTIHRCAQILVSEAGHEPHKRAAKR